jgi:hypothetical protein
MLTCAQLRRALIVGIRNCGHTKAQVPGLGGQDEHRSPNNSVSTNRVVDLFPNLSD